ncbi:MAG: Maf family protein [Bryobacteraceae bacterium]|jgi:septum formation protein
MLVLASQSPRRSELLRQAGLQFIVRIPGVAESRLPGEPPEHYVCRLAVDKARAAAVDPAEFVLAADTVVVADGEVLEKPVSVDDAAHMLRRLSGRPHTVLTGVCVLHAGVERAAVEATQVVFTPMTDEEVLAYAASGEPMDKAGAYAIQGRASKFIERVEGCYFNVVGLPVSLVYRLLKAAGYGCHPR